MQNLKQIQDRDYIMVGEASEDAAGATVWWRLRGDVNREDLVHALEANGCENVRVASHGPEVAIKRAVSVLRGKRRLIRPLAKRGSWAVIEEQLKPSGEELKHWTGPTVSINIIGQAVLKNATAEEAQQVQDAYAYHLEAMTTDDVSSWLIEQVERLGAVGLREGGGIYYLPPTSMDSWRKIIASLHDAAPKHTVYKVPTVRMTRDGARAILDSLQVELDLKVEDITHDVTSGDLGVKALEFRANKARDLLAKVEQYEALLGERQEHMRQVLEKLQLEVVAAKMAAEALADEEAA